MGKEETGQVLDTHPSPTTPKAKWLFVVLPKVRAGKKQSQGEIFSKA